jgi:hypothetical protein
MSWIYIFRGRRQVLDAFSAGITWNQVIETFHLGRGYLL